LQAIESPTVAPQATEHQPATLPAADTDPAAAVPPEVQGSDAAGPNPPESPPPPRIEHRFEPRRAARTTLRTIVGACVLVGLLTTTAAAARLVERFIDTKDQELALVDWVAAQTPADTELFTFGPTLAFRHYSSMPTFDLFDVSAPEVRSIVSDRAPHYLLVDIDSVESQWLNQPPSTNYHLLRDDLGLQDLGTQGTYTLYRVDAAPQ
jgi:hypothetical protein